MHTYVIEYKLKGMPSRRRFDAPNPTQAIKKWEAAVPHGEFVECLRSVVRAEKVVTTRMVYTSSRNKKN